MMVKSILELNSVRLDPVTDTFHLGNGYRMYSPTLKRFICPDDWSPFGSGGINSYTYCSGDPVNYTDQTGHMSIGQWIGMGLGMVAGFALSIATGGASMPAVLSLIATTAGDTAISATSEIVSEVIDGKSIKWGKVGIAAAIGSAASLAGYGLGMLSKLKGTSNRPVGGLMLDGDDAIEAPPPPQRYTVRRDITTNTHVSLPSGFQTQRINYESEAYQAARQRLRLPPRKRYGTMLIPQFGEHRRMIANSVPIYSQELRELAPLSNVYHNNLQGIYNHLGLEPGDINFSVSGEIRTGNLLPLRPIRAEDPMQSPETLRPPGYLLRDIAPISSYEQSQSDDLLDYHYMTHL